ncbi:sensor histidine kinase, partial [Streptomonospora algeriensis]
MRAVAAEGAVGTPRLGDAETGTVKDRLFGLLHLLTSFALSIGYLLPGLLVILPAVALVLSFSSGLIEALPEGILPSTTVLAALAVPLLAAATLIARLACRIQRHRLEDVFGIVESRAEGPPAARPRNPALRLLGGLDHLYGRDAWTAVICATLTGVQGVVLGGIALGLVVYGTALALGSLVGLGYALVSGSLESVAAPLAAVFLGPVGAVVGLWAVPPLVRLEVEVSRRLLLDAPEMVVRRRLAQVQDSRLRMVDAAEAERRRIERDLHDGAQQRLLLVTMALSRARARVFEPDEVRALIDEARGEAKAVMAELREVARGLHPRVLTDHGL